MIGIGCCFSSIVRTTFKAYITIQHEVAECVALMTTSGIFVAPLTTSALFVAPLMTSAYVAALLSAMKTSSEETLS